MNNYLSPKIKLINELWATCPTRSQECNTGGVVIDNDPDPNFYVCINCLPILGEMAGRLAMLGSNHTDRPPELYLNDLIVNFWHAFAIEQKNREIAAAKNITNNSSNGAGYVYLMQRNDGDCKIGLSCDVDRRLEEIRREFPSVKLLHVFEADHMAQAENRLHRQYDHQRKDGEWFALFAEDIDSIKTLVKYENGRFLVMDRTRGNSNEF